LEFLSIPAKSGYLEKDLETCIIQKLQQFLLQLGEGFSFVAQQKRISIDDENFYIDLIFYNYILKCFVDRLEARQTSTSGLRANRFLCALVLGKYERRE
jgi:predicted nuclease of restriction endonuclease-like (RecB) superfamily